MNIEDIRASNYVVAAICGCWYQESGVNPGLWETRVVCPWDHMHSDNPPAGGFGFGQWTNTGGGYAMRCLNLHNWVNSHGYTDGEGAGQIAYFVVENMGSGETGFWLNHPVQRGSYRTLQEFLSTESTDIETLVWDFLASWEGVPGDKYSIRVDSAKRYLEYINAHANDNPADYATAISRNDYLSDAETLHNVMFVYFALNGYLTSGLDTRALLMLTIAAKRRRRNLGRSKLIL